MTPQPWADPELSSRGRLPDARGPARRPRSRSTARGASSCSTTPTDPAPMAGRGATSRCPAAGRCRARGTCPIYTNVQMPFPDRPPAIAGREPDRRLRAHRSRSRRLVRAPGRAPRRRRRERAARRAQRSRTSGVSKDSHLAAEFDITRCCGRGANDLRLTVVKWSDASFVEDQDQWWHGGITRSVFLYATGPAHLADVGVDAGLDEDLSTGTLELEVGRRLGRRRVPAPDGASRPTVDGPRGAPRGGRPAGASAGPTGPATGWSRVRRGAGSSTSRASPRPERSPTPRTSPAGARASRSSGRRTSGRCGSRPDPRRRAVVGGGPAPVHARASRSSRPTAPWWSASSSGSGSGASRSAASSCSSTGEPVLIHGVNRHDFDPRTGRVVEPEDMRADVVAMKRFDFNAVRTSHYPNDPRVPRPRATSSGCT